MTTLLPGLVLQAIHLLANHQFLLLLFLGGVIYLMERAAGPRMTGRERMRMRQIHSRLWRERKYDLMIVLKSGVPLPKRESVSAALPKSDSGWNQRWWRGEIVSCKICHAEYLLKKRDQILSGRTWHDDERGCQGTGSFRCPNCCMTIHFQVQLRPDGKAALLDAEVISL